jgi:acyl-coenzyme A thioesterase PaaI-like protein
MSAPEEHHRKLERLYLSAPTNAYYKPAISIDAGSAEIQIEVRPDFFHAAAAVHGSVYFKLLDDAGFFATNSLVPDVMVLTANFTIHLLRPVSSGRLTARGRARLPRRPRPKYSRPNRHS